MLIKCSLRYKNGFVCSQSDRHLEIFITIGGNHGLVLSPKDWQYSSFHRYVQRGIYDVDWGVWEILVFDSWVGME